MRVGEGGNRNPRYNSPMIDNLAAYHFVAIDDPGAVAAWLRGLAEAGGLRGTVLVAPEGINLFLAGEIDAIDTLIGTVRGDARFATLQVKRSRSDGVPFARLKVKVKTVKVKSPAGSVTEVPESILAALLDSGYSKTK